MIMWPIKLIVSHLVYDKINNKYIVVATETHNEDGSVDIVRSTQNNLRDIPKRDIPKRDIPNKRTKRTGGGFEFL